MQILAHKFNYTFYNTHIDLPIYQKCLIGGEREQSTLRNFLNCLSTSISGKLHLRELIKIEVDTLNLTN